MKNFPRLLCWTLSGLALLNLGIGIGDARGFAAENDEPVRILFIGNSFTYFNSLDQLVQDMLTVSGVPTKAVRNAPGGWRLSGHFKGEVPNDKFKPTPDVIRSEKWDFVVLQEQSAGAVNERDEFLEFGEKINQTIHENRPETKVLLYQTWGRCGGMFAGYESEPSRQDEIVAAWEKRYERKVDEKIVENLKDGIQGGYQKLSQKIDATIVPVGKAFATVDGQVDLYCDEGKQIPFHPNEAGTFLAACAFFKTISGRSPIGLYEKLTADGRTFDFSAETAAILEKTADRVVELPKN